ncbi:MAG: DUF2000 domain-containing protein [Firmicutes bacterium]|nr:DUF2000 domain-containing protein [Bacillota bacterium]
MYKEVRTVVYDEELRIGIIANTAAVMGITLGKAMPEVVGADVRDESGHTHLGIIEFPVPILRGSPESTLQYFGVAVCGAKKKVNKLTGSLPLPR